LNWPEDSGRAFCVNLACELVKNTRRLRSGGGKILMTFLNRQFAETRGVIIVVFSDATLI
jgi:hypothetical protein